MKEFYCTFEIDGVGHEAWISEDSITVCNDKGLDVELPGESGELCKAFKECLVESISYAKRLAREHNSDKSSGC